MMKARRGIEDLLPTVTTLLVAALLIMQSVRICRAGILTEPDVRSAYSREIVSARLKEIAWAFGLWVISLVIAGTQRARHPVSAEAFRYAPTPLRTERQGLYRTVRVVLYLVAAALVIVGICNGGMQDVLVKAIHICTECIGLG